MLCFRSVYFLSAMGLYSHLGRGLYGAWFVAALAWLWLQLDLMALTHQVPSDICWVQAVKTITIMIHPRTGQGPRWKQRFLS